MDKPICRYQIGYKKLNDGIQLFACAIENHPTPYSSREEMINDTCIGCSYYNNNRWECDPNYNILEEII